MVSTVRSNGGSVRLFAIAAQFGEDFVPRNADRRRYAKLFTHPAANGGGDRFAIPEQAGRTGNIQPGLVNAKTFNLIGVIAIYCPGQPGKAQILAKVCWYNHQARALLLCLPNDIAGLDAIGFGRVVFGKDNAMTGFGIAAYGDRFIP